MARLNIHSNILAFGDADTVTSNPKLRHWDWTTDFTQIDVASPESKQFELAPAETQTLFSGLRTIGHDNSTGYSLTLSALTPGVYRLTYVPSESNAPAFRTTRNFGIGSDIVTVAINNNATATFTLSDASLGTFAEVAVGDTVFIPDVTTGDSQSPFNILNVGFWVVLGVTQSGGGPRKLTCRRKPGESFQGAAEVVTVTDSAQFRAFSSGPVQVGDYLELNAGFSPVTFGTYQITTVTDTWVEFASSEALPLEDYVTPGADGLHVYSSAMSFIRVEVDQPCFIRLNGSTGNEIQLNPRQNGDLEGRAYFEMWGTVWQLDVVNRSPFASVTVQLISAAEAV